MLSFQIHVFVGKNVWGKNPHGQDKEDRGEGQGIRIVGHLPTHQGCRIKI